MHAITPSLLPPFSSRFTAAENVVAQSKVDSEKFLCLAFNFRP